MAASLAKMEAVNAQTAAAQTKLAAAFSKEMADANGKMFAEYVAMDAMEPLPLEVVERELVMKNAAEIGERQAEH